MFEKMWFSENTPPLGKMMFYGIIDWSLIKLGRIQDFDGDITKQVFFFFIFNIER
jgi:hypothetical protein